MANVRLDKDIWGIRAHGKRVEFDHEAYSDLLNSYIPFADQRNLSVGITAGSALGMTGIKGLLAKYNNFDVDVDRYIPKHRRILIFCQDDLDATNQNLFMTTHLHIQHMTDPEYESNEDERSSKHLNRIKSLLGASALGGVGLGVVTGEPAMVLSAVPMWVVGTAGVAWTAAEDQHLKAAKAFASNEKVLNQYGQIISYRNPRSI